MKRVAILSLAALGVVYGDIGTSPLYAMRESLIGLRVSPDNVLGVLALIFWSLIIVISIKYLIFILRADNDGEGGVLALLALLKRENGRWYKWFFYVGILGAGLLLGDAMLTPAISVLSAIEGLQVIAPGLSDFVIPLTLLILFTLFLFQYHGTEHIGRFFGPILLFWFITIGTLGAIHIIENPSVLRAVNPYYAFQFFYENGLKGYLLLGGVFLVMTGGEALYADLGHFGRLPIRIGWFAVALPALLLNYFGQGAYLLKHPAAINNPFYALAPTWFSFPLLLIATVATVIASQAVISAAFSLTKQAVLLDLYPRLPIVQTSEEERGQIYVPQMNFILAIGTILLILSFRSSSALAHAYGIAVNLDMIGVTLMVTRIAYAHWRWSAVKVFFVFFIFVLIDLAFLGANLEKLESGGWVPLAFALVCVVVMVTWKNGMDYLRTSFYKERINLKDIADELSHPSLTPLPDSTAIFISDPYDKSGGSLLHYLKLNRIIPAHILIVSIRIRSHPHITGLEKFEVETINRNLHRVILHFGFMDNVNVPETLRLGDELKIFPFHLDVDAATFLIEIPNIIATRRTRTLLFYWQEKLFAFLMRNAELDIEFLSLPYNRTIAIGAYCEI